MTIEGLIEFDFGGRLNRTDLQFFGVLNALVRSVVDFALAYDLNFDLLNLEIPALDIDLTALLDDFSLDALIDLVEQLDPIFDLLEDLLTDPNYPNFLMLKGEEGEARVQASGREFGMLFDRLHLLIQTAYSEPGAQYPNTVHVIDADRNGRLDRQTDPLFIPGIGGLEADLVNGLDVLAGLTATAFWDTTSFDIDPTKRNPFYIAFANDLLVALDVLPLVLDQETLASLLEALGIDPSFLPDNFEIIIPEIPYILPIDIGPWFAEPSTTGLRDLLWDILDLWDLVTSLLPSE
jgi:hypothetical protein